MSINITNNKENVVPKTSRKNLCACYFSSTPNNRPLTESHSIVNSTGQNDPANKSNNKLKESVSFIDSSDLTDTKMDISYSDEMSEQFSSNSSCPLLEINVFEAEINEQNVEPLYGIYFFLFQNRYLYHIINILNI